MSYSQKVLNRATDHQVETAILCTPGYEWLITLPPAERDPLIELVKVRPKITKSYHLDLVDTILDVAKEEGSLSQYGLERAQEMVEMANK